jgi:hypothetical protein
VEAEQKSLNDHLHLWDKEPVKAEKQEATVGSDSPEDVAALLPCPLMNIASLVVK